MGDKFDKIVGNMKIVLNGKEYPFGISMRGKGQFSTMRLKQDHEKLLIFIYGCFKAGYIEECTRNGTPATPEQVTAYEDELDALFLSDYDKIYTEVMILLGAVKRETIEKMEKKIEQMTDGDFLSQMVEKKMGSN